MTEKEVPQGALSVEKPAARLRPSVILRATTFFLLSWKPDSLDLSATAMNQKLDADPANSGVYLRVAIGLIVVALADKFIFV